MLLIAMMAWPLALQARPCAAFTGRSAQAHDAARKGGAAAAGAVAAHGLDLASLDRSVSPCQDFYQFADGGWIRSHQIPSGASSWGLIDELRQRNQKILRQILEREAAARAQATPGTADQKLGNFYASCMDTRAIDRAGWRPLAPEFWRIARLRRLDGLETEVARLQGMGVDAIFRFGASPDLAGSGQTTAMAYPGGLALPELDDYLRDDADFEQLRRKYLLHVAHMFHLLGDPSGDALSEAQTVLRVETLLAHAAMGPLGRSDPEASYRKMSVGELQGLTPHFSWKRYFQQLGLPAFEQMGVSQPDFFQEMDRDLASVSLGDWKIYLRWQLIHAFAPDLSAPLAEENFDFYGRTLAGAAEMLPRWQQCVDIADRELPGPLGRQFASQVLSPAIKANALAMVLRLKAAFRADLEHLYWMDPATRAAAVAKLDKMTIQVGYPDAWPSDSAYRVSAGPFVENVIGGNQFHFQADLAGIDWPVDHARWLIAVSAVDPIYDPSLNEIFVPAGILQPPFFDPASDDALNYGGIGAVIGHEMTHGFNGEGSRFGGNGGLKDWWTTEDRENFQPLAECVADQYDTYAVADDLHENGHLVLHESIADIGGLTIAYEAFEQTAEFRSREKIQDFTSRQRFFLAYARVWTAKQTPQYLRRMASADPHPIARYRVIGPLADFEPFAEAFHCADKDAMVRPGPDRCGIW